MVSLRMSVCAGVAALSLAVAGCGSSSGDGGRSRVDSRDQRAATASDRSLRTAAGVSERTGDYGSAADYYHKLYEKDQNNPEFVTGLSRNLRYGGQGAEARLFMDLVVQSGVDTPAVRAEYGKAQLADGLPEKAMANLQGAVSMGDGSWQAHPALGTAFDRLGKFSDAQKSYQRAIAISPENPTIVNNLALSLAVSGKLKEAIKILEKVAVRPRPSSRRQSAWHRGFPEPEPSDLPPREYRIFRTV
mgnify:CR=1 FL=1|jgi:Flp pilus assembly protein TadD